MTIKIVILIIGLLLGALVTALFAKARIKGDKDKMAIMRNCSNRQDDSTRRRDNTVRLKQARIDELEREARSAERKK